MAEVMSMRKNIVQLSKIMTLKMNDDELVHDMYSRLNLIINELHSIGLTKLDDERS